MSLRSTWILLVCSTLCAITTVRACDPLIRGMEIFSMQVPCKSFSCPPKENPEVCDFTAALRQIRLDDVKQGPSKYIKCQNFSPAAESALKSYLETKPTSFYYQDPKFQRYFADVEVQEGYELIGFVEECIYNPPNPRQNRKYFGEQRRY